MNSADRPTQLRPEKPFPTPLGRGVPWLGPDGELEREALALSWYDNQVIPGLLQTEKYARPVFRNRVPVFSEDEICTQTTNRLERQALLHRPSPPTISMVIWEPFAAYIGG